MDPNPKIARLYAGVLEDSLSRLRAFRERFPYQSVSISGIEWNYIDSGPGKPPLFIPAGGTSIAEVSFFSLEHFAEQYRVISPDYPPIEELDVLFSGFMEACWITWELSSFTLWGAHMVAGWSNRWCANSLNVSARWSLLQSVPRILKTARKLPG